MILLKSYASNEGVLKELDVMKKFLKQKLKTINTYIEALCISFICSLIQNQNDDFSENSTKHLLRLRLADMFNNFNKPINILVSLIDILADLN